MATEQTQIKPVGLARRLIRDSLLSEQQAQTAYAEAARKRQPFIQFLVAEKLVESRSIAIAASQEFGIPLLDLDAMELMELPFATVDEKLIRKHHALPIHRRGKPAISGGV